MSNRVVAFHYKDCSQGGLFMSALNIYSVGLDVSSRSSMVAIAQTSLPSLQVKIGKPFSRVILISGV